MTNPPATKTPIKPTARTGKKGGLDEASIDTFADHEVVTPKRNLKSFSKKAKIKVDEFGFDVEAIERAEAALQELSSEFDDWMAKEVERLTKGATPLPPRPRRRHARRRYTAAHDLKGEAATFGYPLAGGLPTASAPCWTASPTTAACRSRWCCSMSMRSAPSSVRTPRAPITPWR